MNSQLLVLLAVCVSVSIAQKINGVDYPRWEHRTIDCIKEGKCVSHLKGEKSPCRDVTNADGEKVTLCALGCSTATRVDPIAKSNAVKFEECHEHTTFGKERQADDWYIWIKKPCVPTITADCLFNRPSFEQTV